MTLRLASPSAAEPIAISSHPQLFLDDLLVAREVNLQRVLHSPVKHPANPVIVRNFPWESRVIEVYGTVLFDEETKKFRCWYLASGGDTRESDTATGKKLVEYYQCYAESDDGLHWNKPFVGTRSFESYKQHNIVISGGHGFCVLPTPDDPDPSRKFKGAGGAIFGFSPDGIEWTVQNWRGAVAKNDTGTSIVRWKGEYLAYVRYQITDPDWQGVMRGVGLSTSPDFENWSPKELIFRTDGRDGYPWTQPYGMAVTAYGDQLIGLVWFLHLDRIQGNNSVGSMDVQMMVSRDGRTWDRVADRQTFLSPTPDGWDRARVFPSTTMLVKDDQVYIYFTGATGRHGQGWGEPGIGLATLPADRFVALRPQVAGQPGILETPVFHADGQRLLVNAEAQPGDLQVELLTAAGDVVPGFDRLHSKLAPVDALRHAVSWTDASGARQFADRAGGEPVAIRFILNAGSLYAFHIRP